MIYFRKGELCEDCLGLDLSQPAFRTGFGFFETIAWNGRSICHLDLHMQRARRSLAQFNIIEESVEYEKVILKVVEANGLNGEFARVNIFFPVEQGRAFPVICAVPFEHVPGRTWTLKPCEDVFLSSLMRHKTMNRMSYLTAWQDAAADGYNDALLQDFEGMVLESSFASLLFFRDGRFYEPRTDYKLPGTAQMIAAAHIKIEPLPIHLDSISDFEHVYALNSLGGMLSVSSIGNTFFDTEHCIAERITSEILSF